MSSGLRCRTREREIEGVRHYHTHVSEIGGGVANRSELPGLIPSSTSDYPGSNGVHTDVYNTLHIHQNQKQERVMVSYVQFRESKQTNIGYNSILLWAGNRDMFYLNCLRVLTRYKLDLHEQIPLLFLTYNMLTHSHNQEC